LLNQKFLLHVDCKSAKEVLQKDVQNLASKTDFCPMASYFKHFFILILSTLKEIQVQSLIS